MTSYMPPADAIANCYDKQHNLEANLFLAPGEGDAVPEDSAAKKEAKEVSAASVLRGQVQ